MGLFSIAPKASPDAVRDDAETFWKRGFVIVRNAFTRAEMAILKDIITRHSDMQAFARRAKERSAGSTRPSFETIYVWNDTARNDAFAKAITDPAVKDRLIGLGFAPEIQDPAAVSAFMKSEAAKWAKVIKDNNITAE